MRSPGPTRNYFLINLVSIDRYLGALSNGKTRNTDPVPIRHFYWVENIFCVFSRCATNVIAGKNKVGRKGWYDWLKAQKDSRWRPLRSPTYRSEISFPKKKLEIVENGPKWVFWAQTRPDCAWTIKMLPSRWRCISLLPTVFLASNTAKTFSAKLSIRICHFHEAAEGLNLPPELPNLGHFSPNDAIWVTKSEQQMSSKRLFDSKSGLSSSS